MVGATISHYKITDKLGEGGMGVVYKAEDTRLERTVALKFLAAHLLNDDEAKARFLREAKAAAGLHHPNICPVHEIGEAEGKTFLSMAFIEGESLEARIEQGPLPLKDALEIGRQIAEGLEAAHEKGVVHRDIKPANVMVDAKGRTTIMDFGLARLTEASRLTKADQTMGTVAYMSPEQAQGMEVDNRSDIWALGVVLYEMVRGQRPFQGQYDQALLYEIVHQEPEPLTGVRAGVPMELEFIVGKCLAKDREDRPASAQEIVRDLRILAEKLKSGRSTILSTGLHSKLGSGRSAILTADSKMDLPARGASQDASPWGQRLPWALVASLTVTLLALTWLWPTSDTVPEPVRRFSFTFPDVVRASVSPNGRHIAYESSGQLWIRDLDQDEPRMLHDEGERPFWSPDSLLLGFHAEGQLWKIAAHGGSVDLLCEAGRSIFGAAWSPNGESIVFGGSMDGSRGLFAVPARGGTPRAIVSADEIKLTEGGTTFLRDPSFLPDDNRRLLAFTAVSLVAANVVRETKLVVQDLESGQTEVLTNGAEPFFTSNGHLVFRGTADRLWALPLSLETLNPNGEAFPIARLGAYPSISSDGSLVYLVPSQTNSRLVWHDREGNVLEAVGQPRPDIRFPNLSPDGESVVAAGDGDIWLHDLRRSLATNMTASVEQEAYPTWAPWGAVFKREDDLYYRPLDLIRDSELLIGKDSRLSVYDIDASGRDIVYGDRKEGSWDIWRLERNSEGTFSEPELYFGSEFATVNGQISPDGRYLAYVSKQGGRGGNWEVFVQPFPGGGPQVKVSVGDGNQQRWNPNGGELFYVEQDTLISVEVTTETAFRAGKTTRLFSSQWLQTQIGRPTYAVGPDGNRFLLVTPDPEADASPPKVQLVENWYEEFRDREQD